MTMTSAPVRCPYPSSLGTVLSNFDHAIEVPIVEQLKLQEAYADYTAWNFFGLVWWDRAAARWKCEVRQYHQTIEVLDEGSLEDIMTTACGRYGSD
jgi:hypothetical protein